MMCYGDLDPKLRTLTGDFMSKKLTYMKLSLQRCIEPASTPYTLNTKYCADDKEMKDFFTKNN